MIPGRLPSVVAGFPAPDEMRFGPADASIGPRGGSGLQVTMPCSRVWLTSIGRWLLNFASSAIPSSRAERFQRFEDGSVGSCEFFEDREVIMADHRKVAAGQAVPVPRSRIVF